MMPMYDSLEYHKQAIARELMDQHPDVQRAKREIEAKVSEALQGCRDMVPRQNRSSADRYPTPPVRMASNPTGAKRKR